MKTCPPLDAWKQLLTGKPLDSRGALDAHLAKCQTCQDTLDRLTDDGLTRNLRKAVKKAPVNKQDPALAALLTQLRDSGPPTDNAATPRPKRSTPPPNKIKHYRLVKRLGQGATSEVYLARDERLHRHVALKVLRSELAVVPEVRERFEREARAAAALHHENVVTIFEVIAEPNLPSCLVLEYVAGETLSERLKRGETLEVRDAVNLVLEAARGLAAAHEQGLVHRDVKPSNVLIEAKTGRAKVADFGLALDHGDASLTHDGHVLGTPAYMSPEQASGRSHEADARSDVYSLGVVLYQLLTGHLPFEGSSRQMMYQAVHEQPTAPRRHRATLCPRLEAIVMRCLAKRPDQRYTTAHELALDLSRWSRGERVTARHTPSRWRGVAAVVAGLCFLTALAAGAVLAWQHFTSPPITADNGARRALMLSYQDHGDDLWCADNFTGARDQYLKALEIAESLAAVQPHGDQEKSDLLSVLRDLGDVHDQLNEVEPALRYHIRARDAAEQWRRSTPDSISALRALAETYLSLGQLDAISDHESKEYLRKAVPLWERLNRDEPGDRDDQHGLMSAYLELAGRHFEDGEKQSSDDLYGKADGLAVSLAATAASVEDKVDVLLFRILALAHRGRHQELADLAEQLHTLGPKDDVTLYNMACCYAQCVPAVAHGRARRDLTDADLKLQEQYADRAVSFLNKSLTAGFSDLKLLLRDPDLKPLRNHTGYRDIVKRVKAVSSASP